MSGVYTVDLEAVRPGEPNVCAVDRFLVDSSRRPALDGDGRQALDATGHAVFEEVRGQEARDELAAEVARKTRDWANFYERQDGKAAREWRIARIRRGNHMTEPKGSEEVSG